MTLVRDESMFHNCGHPPVQCSKETTPLTLPPGTVQLQTGESKQSHGLRPYCFVSLKIEMVILVYHLTQINKLSSCVISFVHLKPAPVLKELRVFFPIDETSVSHFSRSSKPRRNRNYYTRVRIKIAENNYVT